MNAKTPSIAALAFAFLGAAAPMAQAQDLHAGSAPDTSTTSIEFIFRPGVWLTRANGESTLGNSPAATPILLQDALDLDEFEAAFNAELAMIKDDMWRLGVNGFHFSTDSDGAFIGETQFGDLSLSDGDPFNASFEMTSLAIDFSFWLWEPYCVGEDCRLGVRLGPLLAARHVDVDQSIAANGMTVGADGEWLAPMAGLRLEMHYDAPDSWPWIDSITIDAGGAIGPALGGDGGMVAQLHTGVTASFSPHVGIGLEYRLIHLDVENADYHFDGGLQGLFFFASIEF